MRRVLLVLILLLGRCAVAEADDASVVVSAWKQANSMVPRVARLPEPPPVRFIEPVRYVLISGQFVRMCGETVQLGGGQIVFIYTGKREAVLAFDSLVHEFLHVLDNAGHLRGSMDAETWVTSLWPRTCPTAARPGEESPVDHLHEGVKIRKEDVLINFVEVPKGNWSFGNGEAQYVTPPK